MVLVARAAQRQRAAVGTDARVHDRQHDPRRQELHGARERERPGEHVVAGDRVVDVDHPGLGAAAGDHTVADADELVLVAVVGEEADEHPPASGGCGRRQVGEDRLDHAVDVVALGLHIGGQPRSASAAVVTGPIDTTRVAGESPASPPAAARKKLTVDEEVKVT